MKKLLSIEWQKMNALTSFKMLIGAYFLGLVGIYLLIGTLMANIPREVEMVLGDVYDFPQAWYNINFLAYWLSFFPAIFMIILVTMEFQHGTLRQNVMDGMSRGQFMAGKILSGLMISLAAMVVMMIAAVLGSLFFAQGLDTEEFVSKMPFLVQSGVQVFTLLMLGMAYGMLFKKQGLSILLFLLTLFPFELIVRGLFNQMGLDSITGYFPFVANFKLLAYNLGDLIEGNFNSPIEWKNIGINLLWCAVIIGFSMMQMKKRDLR